jgi:hypothetical protein
MYRITIYGRPYLRPMNQLDAERLVARLVPVIKGIGMMKVRP